METFSDDLACIGDKQKGVRRIFFDKVSKPYRFHPVQDREYNILIVSRKCTFCIYDSGAPVQTIFNKIADRLRGSADYVKIF